MIEAELICVQETSCKIKIVATVHFHAENNEHTVVRCDRTQKIRLQQTLTEDTRTIVSTRRSMFFICSSSNSVKCAAIGSSCPVYISKHDSRPLETLEDRKPPLL